MAYKSDEIFVDKLMTLCYSCVQEFKIVICQPLNLHFNFEEKAIPVRLWMRNEGGHFELAYWDKRSPTY